MTKSLKQKNLYEIENRVIREYVTDILGVRDNLKKGLKERGYEQSEISDMVKHAENELSERVYKGKSNVSPKETKVFKKKIQDKFGGIVKIVTPEEYSVSMGMTSSGIDPKGFKTAHYNRHDDNFGVSDAIYVKSILNVDGALINHEKRHREQAKVLDGKKKDYALQVFAEADADNHSISKIKSDLKTTKKMISNLVAVQDLLEDIDRRCFGRITKFTSSDRPVGVQQWNYVSYTIAPAVYHHLEKEGKTRDEIKDYFIKASKMKKRGIPDINDYAARLLEGLE